MKSVKKRKMQISVMIILKPYISKQPKAATSHLKGALAPTSYL